MTFYFFLLSTFCSLHVLYDRIPELGAFDFRRSIHQTRKIISDRLRRDRATAEACLAKTSQKYQSSALRLAQWMAENLPEGFTVFSFPSAFQRLVRTTNGVYRLHPEACRRARIVSIFPDPASCLRSVSAVLNEISEEWVTGRTYISFEGDILRPKEVSQGAA